MLRFTALLLSALLPFPAFALCDGPSFWTQLTPAQQLELTQRVVDTPYGTGNFWRASKDGTTLTIVGTMHLPDPRHETFVDLSRPFVEQADLLLVEATLQDQKDMQVHMARNPDMVTINDGTTLPDYVDEAIWAQIRDAATERGIPGFMAAKMQPWFLSLTLSVPPCAMAAMASGDGGLDTALMEIAEDAGVPVAPLEPWENMLALISSGTFEEQIDALRMGILAPELHASSLVALTDFYFAEQTAMGWYITEYTKEYLPPDVAAQFDELWAELEEVLLTQRNIDWIPVIEDAATLHDEIFIGFGAAHLIGENGVLYLLEQNGWTVTPI